MKINTLNQNILDLDGIPFQENTGQNEKGEPALRELTLKDVMIKALTGDHVQERCPHCQGGKVPEVEKYKRYHLARKIKNAEDEIELQAEEIALIKKLINWLFLVVVVGYAFDLIEKGGK